MTSSGTGAIRHEQGLAIVRSCDPLGGWSSLCEPESLICDLTGEGHLLPTERGRAKGRILFGAIIDEPRATRPFTCGLEPIAAP